MLMKGYLRRADDACTLKAGKGKEKKPSDWLQIGRLAVRMVPLVSRCRALGEAAHDGNYWFDNSPTIRRRMEDEELQEDSVISILEITADDGSPTIRRYFRPDSVS